MKRIIYKYQVDFNFVLSIPTDAKFLSFQNQFGNPVVWFELDPLASPVDRKFSLIGTGTEFSGGQYLSTVQDGPLVWHLYETTGL